MNTVNTVNAVNSVEYRIQDLIILTTAFSLNFLTTRYSPLAIVYTVAIFVAPRTTTDSSSVSNASTLSTLLPGLLRLALAATLAAPVVVRRDADENTRTTDHHRCLNRFRVLCSHE